ncbi:MAG: histidine phosphatase family protein [Planctomycetota bacterium]
MNRAGSPLPPDAAADLALPHPHPHPGWGTGTRVWLVRHAEVHPDWQGRAYGTLDVPLSAEGEERTREMGRDFGCLDLAVVISSPLERAARLGRAVAAGAGLAAIPEDGLREIHRGRWEGLAVDELHARFPAEIDAFYADPWGWAGHGGENDAAIAARAWPAVERAVQRTRGGTILAATHYNVIRVLVGCALALPPGRTFALRVDTGGAVLLVDAPGGWRLVHSNVPAPPAGGGAE